MEKSQNYNYSAQKHGGFMSSRFNLLVVLIVLLCTFFVASAAAEDDEIEEIIVTGTQIQGANISDALAVSVTTAEDLEILGIESGDELLDLLPENGQNFVNEAENISGGVNSARGDVGAFNLRNIGTGNTLVLINGRRLVNDPGFQTEEVGGSFVPVNSPNSNSLPIWGVERTEILRDGASAIYGADAVAGVVNTVLKSDFEGLNVRFRYSDYESLPRDDQRVTVEWGKFFNGGRTNVSVFADYYQNGRVNSQDDPRWANSDFRDRIPVGSPWEGSTSFRNDSSNSIFGQFDLVDSASANGLSGLDITDSSGEFEVFPAGDPRCTFDINAQVCADEDGNGTERYNLNENRDLVSEKERATAMVFINHEFDSGLESFTELSFYQSSTNLIRHPSSQLSAVKLEVGANNYYNPFGPVGSPNRLPDTVIGTDVDVNGLALIIDNYRFTEVPRIVDNDADSYRLLQGFRGDFANDWSWESAVLWSKATRDDITRNRISNTLMQEALNDPTPAAYNPFSGGVVESNIERALVDVKRNSESDLFLIDAKFFKNDLFKGWAGDIAGLVGLEYRDESFDDDRDDRLDGTIRFIDRDGDEFPFVSDVANSSPTADNSGSRDVTSLFGELQVPLHETLDLQLALRYEDFSDVGDTTVGKVAFGWRPIEQVLVRGSWSQAFRAPNLVTINEDIVARSNTRTDFACEYVLQVTGDPADILDCSNNIQRTAQGSAGLEPEESDNTSFGIVLEPIDGLTFTLDFWSIEKENTIGLFGEENHTILDLLQRLDNGLNNCGAATFNPAVVRDSAIDSDINALYQAAGICGAGDVLRIDDQYANLNDRTIEGHDIGIYYSWDSSIGDFSLKYNGSFLDTFDQDAGGDAALLLEAQNDGTLPVSIPVDGFSDLIRRDGNQDEKHLLTLGWRYNDFGASISGSKLGDFYQSSLTLGDGTRYNIPSMTTWNATFDYRTQISGMDTRFRLGVRNLTDERAPLADRFFGYFADAHRDLGRSFYVDVRLDAW